jgi:hypothetical protein
MDGNLVLQGTRDSSATVTPLAASSTHTFTVRARDFGGNWSPVSEPLTVTTIASNPNDHTAPTIPTNLSGGGVGDGSAEIDLTSNQSTYAGVIARQPQNARSPQTSRSTCISACFRAFCLTREKRRGQTGGSVSAAT